MATPQRIAFLTPRFSEQATIGGAETLLKNLALRAAAAGHEVTILTTCARNHFTWANEIPPGTRSVQGLTVHYFPVNEDRDLAAFLTAQTRISGGGEVNDATETTWMQHNVNSRALNDHLTQHGDAYDALVMGPYLFGLIYYAAQIHPHKTLLVPCLHDEPFAHLRVMHTLFHAVAGLLFNTEPEQHLAERLYQIPTARAAVVGMGLDPFTADPDSFRRRHRIDTPYVLYAGRREPLKGTPLLLDYLHAFRKRTGHDLRLVLTGSGPIEPPADLAPAILDLGFVSEQEKHDAMAGALAFIHPSLNESLGIVLLEAWLAGTPGLVHAESPVLRWQCATSGGGLWFRHYPDFEEILLRLLADTPLTQQLGESGRAYVQRTYAWPAVEQRFFDALQRLPHAPA